MSDREAVLRGRLERNEVCSAHLRIAAWLGDDAAAAVVGRRWSGGEVESWSWPSRHALSLAKIDRRTRARAEAAIAARVLDIVEKSRPDEDAPRLAIEAALAYANNPSRKNMASAKLAAKAARVLSKELFGGPVSERNESAGFATEAAACAADVAAGDYADNPEDQENSANYARYATHLSKAEAEAQRRLLVFALCGDELPALPERERSAEDASRDRVQVLKHRLRLNITSRERLRIAAWLGDAAALAVVKTPWPGDAFLWSSLSRETRTLMIATLCGDQPFCVIEPVQTVVIGSD